MGEVYEFWVLQRVAVVPSTTLLKNMVELTKDSGKDVQYSVGTAEILVSSIIIFLHDIPKISSRYSNILLDQVNIYSNVRARTVS